LDLEINNNFPRCNKASLSFPVAKEISRISKECSVGKYNPSSNCSGIHQPIAILVSRAKELAHIYFPAFTISGKIQVCRASAMAIENERFF